ncbi:MAG: hypothetical protein QM692_23765, partial [Thermomicrobiales bacterium]
CAVVIVFGAIYVIRNHGQTLLIGAGVLIFLAFAMSSGGKSAPPTPEEQARRRQSFINYQIAQDTAARSEAHREQMAQWRQAQQPPPADPSTWGGDCSGRNGGRRG